MLNRFEIKRVCFHEHLGRGGFGKVHPYAKRDGTTNDYAVKVVSMKEKPPIEEILVGFQIKHPFAIPILGYHIEKPSKDGGDWRCFLKMRRMKQSMKDLIEKRVSPLTKNQIVICLYRLASTLAYLQSNDIAHRDVKPNNILLDNHDNVYFADFGLCISMIEKEHTEVFYVNGIAGTEAYLAPELNQLKEKKAKLLPENLYHGDAWSLGVTMIDICLFEIRGRGHMSSLSAKLERISEKYDLNIKNVISRLIDEDPAKRITFSEVCDFLEKNYGNSLEETLEILHEEVQQSESFQKKLREKNEARMARLSAIIARLSSDFSKDFRFHFVDGKLLIFAKDRLKLSDDTLKRLSNDLKENLEGDCIQILKAIDIDLSLCQNLTDEGISYLDFLTGTDLIQEISLNLLGCIKISHTGVLDLFSKCEKNLQKLKSLCLNMASCRDLTTESFMVLLDDITKKFTKLKFLNLNFSECKAIDLTKQEITSLKKALANLESLQEFTLDLSHTKSDREETRSSIEYALSEIAKVSIY